MKIKLILATIAMLVSTAMSAQNKLFTLEDLAVPTMPTCVLRTCG